MSRKPGKRHASAAPSPSRQSALASAQPAKRGRPTVRSPEAASRICALISEGRSLRSIAGTEGLPSLSAIKEWLAEDRHFAAQYARARENQADHFVDEIVEIADRAIGGTNEDVQARRLAVDARKWVAAKLAPRKYSEKLEMNVHSDFAQRLVAARARAASMRKKAAGDR